MDNQPARNIEPDPKEWGVLTEVVQKSHRSQVVWNTGDCPSLRVRQASQESLGDVHDPDLIPQDLQQHLLRAGFWHVSRMKRLPIDRHLISALVERWRPETHTFHMPVGEMTITLQDVEGILGLSTEGRVVFGQAHGNWAAVMQQYMGRTPLPTVLTGGNIKMSWFERHWGYWEEHSATVEGQLLYTRAYLMRLFGGFLLCDKSSSEVPCRYIQLLGGDLAETATYSWGTAVLTVLFRELCQATSAAAKDIGGCLLLLQIWAWSRFPAISPLIPPPSDAGDHYGRRFNNVHVRLLRRDLKTYRIELDQMGRDDVKWEPYRDVGYEFMGADVHMQDMWRAMTPILAFHIVEMHQPNRCMRQFGMQQHIPGLVVQFQGACDLTLRGKMTDDWEVKMDPFIQLWNTRHLRIETTDPLEGPISPNSEYMTWFFTHTRRYMTRQVARIGHVLYGVEWIWWMNSPQFDSQFSKRQVQEVCDKLLEALREFGRVAEPGSSAPSGLLVGAPDPTLEVLPHAKERRGLGQRRPRNETKAYEIPQLGPRGRGIYRPPVWPNMAYTEVPWYPKQLLGEMPTQVPPEMPAQVPPEIHAPMPSYLQSETMFAPQTKVPYSNQGPSQSSQNSFPTFNYYQPRQGFTGFSAYQPPYGFPSVSAYQIAQGFTAFRSSHNGQGCIDTGSSSSSPYQSVHHTSDDGGDHTEDVIRAAAEDFNFRYNPNAQRGPDGIRRNPERDACSRQ